MANEKDPPSSPPQPPTTTPPAPAAAPEKSSGTPKKGQTVKVRVIENGPAYRTIQGKVTAVRGSVIDIEWNGPDGAPRSIEGLRPAEGENGVGYL